jgi:nucleoside-diphosphate-sugar epimerase
MQWCTWRTGAAGIVAAHSEATNGSAYNLGSEPLAQVEFVRALARAAGREPRLVHVPRTQIEAAGGSILGPPLYFGAYLDIPQLTVRVERVRTELGLELTPLDEGLRQTFEWYRRSGPGRTTRRTAWAVAR